MNISQNPVRIGLFGVGHLGNIHLRLLSENPGFEVIGFFDPDDAKAQKAVEAYGVTRFGDIESLLKEVEAVDIVAPTLVHYDLAKAALIAGCHVFIEKPLAESVAEGEGLLEIAGTRPDLVVQVGHVERFNPAFLALEDTDLKPMFIEGHRLAQYNPRGTDVSVVLDLMIHDLDVILALIESPVTAVHASGVSVVSKTPDIANARIEFKNGAVANLTASRISLKNMRRLRMFQQNGYLAVDFLKKQAEILSLSDTADDSPEEGKMKFRYETDHGARVLVFEQPSVPEVNAIGMELDEFARAIRGQAPVRVPLQAGFRALRVAHMILDKIEEGLKKVN